MSDNSTGSSGSSSNSWTLLSPEEVASDTTGHVDDGTESIGDAPSLSEEVAASSSDVKPSEGEIPLETIFSEEGHQICQETSPEFFEGTASGLAIEADPEICAPIIHDTITSSPPDNDLLGAVPFSIATESALLLSEEPTLEEPYVETFPDVQPTVELPSKESPATESTPEITTNSEPREKSPSPEIPDSTTSGVGADIRSLVSDISYTSAIPVEDINVEAIPGPESLSPSLLSEVDFGSVAESPQLESPYTETITSSALEEEESEIQGEELKPADKSMDVMRKTEYAGVDISVGTPAEGDGLRLRHVPHNEVERQSSDEEEEEFKLPERKEEKAGFSLNHLIVGALVLLCLGSLFFSGSMVDQDGDFDASEPSEQELLEKLAQENKQIYILEAEIQSQKEELHKALRLAADKGTTDVENAMMKEELSALPGLKQELEELRARVMELTQLTAEEASEPSASSVPSSPGVPGESQGSSGPEAWWDKKQELKRQRTLLEESRKRLEGMKKHGWHQKGLRESLVEMQQRLSKQVDHLGKRDEWKRKYKHKEGKKEWCKKKSNHWKVEESGKRKDDGDRKSKDHFKKYQEEWDYKNVERRLERERRKRKERPWQVKLDQHQHNPHHHKQHHLHHESVGFWKHQEEKLRRNKHPPKRCQGVAECADSEGLMPVKLSEFQALLEVYLSKLEGVSEENIEALHRLMAQFFQGGIFMHESMLFREFAEDVADILEDLADVLNDEQQGGDDDVLEEQMEEFEREALWKFAASSA
ncbi:pre-B-cell leukemia transcription factor-interacting protein 1 isoform X2 [Electrophorus electricus]|uniref:pre-B-cell leukemia transcription factor-interacting protein 1 isoform X2 n=1 Tax=Electrophorus electricus TaxID=8005 RepID=UPI0015CFAE2C|nr:pre-B-cell leukemia transcription factor-interacting protein 1 isoform X2 [Electrophorus electricus]